MYKICKRLTFESSHCLWKDGLTAEANQKLFGKCANLPNHGHSYKLYITLKSNELVNGMVINFTDVKKVADEKIIKVFDHHYINNLLPGVLTTAENMCRIFYGIMKKEFPQVCSIKLYETETSWAEYTEEEDKEIKTVKNKTENTSSDVCSYCGKHIGTFSEWCLFHHMKKRVFCNIHHMHGYIENRVKREIKESRK